MTSKDSAGQAKTVDPQSRSGLGSLATGIAVRLGLIDAFLVGANRLADNFPPLQWAVNPPFDAFRQWYSHNFGHVDVITLRPLGIAYTFAVSLIGAIIWFCFDRRRRHEKTIYELLIATTRYALAVIMLSYGMIKIFPIQFGAPGPIDWIRPLGEWKDGILGLSMGYSPSYRVFAGLVEFTAGALLLFPRTATLGAMICAGALANITVLDYGFGYEGMEWEAAEFLVMALFVVMADSRRLINLFVLNQPAASVHREHVRGTPTVNRTILCLRAIIVISAFLQPMMLDYVRNQRRHVKSDLAGVYRVESFAKNGEVEQCDKAEVWRLVAIDGFAEQILVRTLDDQVESFDVIKADDGGSTSRVAQDRNGVSGATAMRLSLAANVVAPDRLPLSGHKEQQVTLTRFGIDRLQLNGTIGNDALTVDLRRVPDDQLPRPR